MVPEGPGDSELLFRCSPRGVAPLVMYRYMWVVTAGQTAQLVLGVEDGRCFINPFFCHHICPTFVWKHRLPRMFPDLNDTWGSDNRSLSRLAPIHLTAVKLISFWMCQLYLLLLLLRSNFMFSTNLMDSRHCYWMCK